MMNENSNTFVFCGIRVDGGSFVSDEEKWKAMALGGYRWRSSMSRRYVVAVFV